MGRMGYPCHYDGAAQVMDEIACVTPSYGESATPGWMRVRACSGPVPPKIIGYAHTPMRADSPEGLDISIPLFTKESGASDEEYPIPADHRAHALPL